MPQTKKFFYSDDQSQKKFGFFMWLSLMTVVISIGIAVFSYFRLQPEIPIFYSLAEPAEQLARKEAIFILPLFGTAIFVLHMLSLGIIKSYDSFLRRLFALVTLVLELLILVVNLRIILLII